MVDKSNGPAPMVSVLMTAYNREDHIAESIESVLASDYPDFELIITDDGSKDNTVAIARSYAAKDPRVKVFQNEKNLGDYPNRNRCAEHATGVYIKYLDSDDVLYYYTLGVMVNYMERFPEAGFGLLSVADSKPFPICLEPREIYRENFYGFGHFDRSPGSSIIRLDAFKAVGGFSGKRMIGDYEFWFKIARYYKMVKLPPDMYWYRYNHGAQETGTGYAQQYPILREEVLNEALAHKDCPLTAGEIQAVRRMLKKKSFKNNVLAAMGKLNRIINRPK